MPEIPELHLPPAAVNNAKQSLRWFLERGHCQDPAKEICSTCAEMVAEAVALGLVGGGGYRIGADGRIHKPKAATHVEREIVLSRRPGLLSVKSDPYEEIERSAVVPPREGS